MPTEEYIVEQTVVYRLSVCSDHVVQSNLAAVLLYRVRGIRNGWRRAAGPDAMSI